jgi:hypothetical protein
VPHTRRFNTEGLIDGRRSLRCSGAHLHSVSFSSDIDRGPRWFPHRERHPGRGQEEGLPPCKKRKQGTCKGKKRDGSACPGGTCRGGRYATCTDGITNGTETDVDCGGSCPRCLDGKRCASGGDCASGFCTGTCQRCTTAPNNCNGDAAGPCFCQSTSNGLQCLRSPTLKDSCEECPQGTVDCRPVGLASGFLCSQLCGTA